VIVFNKETKKVIMYHKSREELLDVISVVT